MISNAIRIELRHNVSTVLSVEENDLKNRIVFQWLTAKRNAARTHSVDYDRAM